MSTVEPWRMPHWLTPVCDDHPVSQPTSTWLPSRIQRCRFGTSPERRARRSTPNATPSSCTNTTPGTSVALAPFVRRLACRATRRSSHESSSMASSALTMVVAIVRPMTITSAVQKPSISTPGRRSSRNRTNRALRMMAPRPSVRTESGTTRKARAGHTTALATPTTNPARTASQNESMENPGRIAASSHSETEVNAVTSRLRQSVSRNDGRAVDGFAGRGVDGAVIVGWPGASGRRSRRSWMTSGSSCSLRRVVVPTAGRSASHHRAARGPCRHHAVRVIRARARSCHGRSGVKRPASMSVARTAVSSTARRSPAPRSRPVRLRGHSRSTCTTLTSVP